MIETKNLSGQDPKAYSALVEHYKKGMRNMNGRAPGGTTISGVKQLTSELPNGYKLPFNSGGRGCGASMRSASIGIRYSK